MLHQALMPCHLSALTDIRCASPQLSIAGHGDLQACLIEHRPDRALAAAPFDPGLFTQLAIECPEPIMRSVPKRQAEFLFGRLAAAQVLRHLGAADVRVGMGSQREPLWPAGWRGSLSHTRRYAMAVASREGACQGLGVDVEHLLDEAQAEAVSRQALNVGELQRLRCTGNLPSEAWLLTLVFSAKECFYKAAFGQVGHFFGFDAVDVVELDSARQSLALRLNLPLGDTFRPGDTVTLSFGLVDPSTVFTCLVLR